MTQETKTVGAGSRQAFRFDIQALRALAVALVVVYHLWPASVLHGGYVGVDVFFVISGFLITGHLLREQENGNGRIRLGRFWARRIRRLLPASLLVLVVTALLTLAFAPAALWSQAFRETIASGFYVENWLLAVDSVDYLAADNLASPVQHYWSLSVEEQFYIVWPLLMVVAVAVGMRLRRSSRVSVLVMLAVIVVVCFAASVLVTRALPSIAYFATFTRAWEFAFGGLVALVPANIIRNRHLRAGASWAGLLAVLGSSAVLTESTPFPGWIAIVPVAGAALVILAGASTAVWSPSWLMRRRAIQFVGDNSYSIYLWHWPLIVLFPFAFELLTGVESPWWAPLVVLALTVALATATKRYIEDPVRTGAWIKSSRRSFGFAVAASAAVALVAAGGLAGVSAVKGQAEQALAVVQQSEPECVGAMASAAGPAGACDDLGEVLPPVLAINDLPAIYGDRCQTGPRSAELKSCEFGDLGSETKVALIGDSHAASWFPAVEEVSREQGWELTTFYKSSCAWSASVREGESAAIDSCSEWNENVSEVVAAGDFDVVVTSYFANSLFTAEPGGEASMEDSIDGFGEAWAGAVEAGAEVIAIEDTPGITPELYRCIYASRLDLADCPAAPVNREELSVYDQASLLVPGSEVVDLSEHFIVDGSVPAEIGGVVVWRDQHHFTATFSGSLADFIEPELLDAVD
ncbi:acyltransferase family protein [Herbiconiux sp. KACC 21604]|uniref:acyltransferase family protein n=1 Tax=unclassified Herbiconiux TaxID=2618217 RepID=UPI0014922E13|nr:acyltransferase family protein [Herbiconiux sp. SALV-R1]QJU54575.1 acyltransferase [Herbiconiux sp. SALV-R1]WPO85660.1 acyltransferase family protein [Herbiconiux sp. KACC 21604]